MSAAAGLDAAAVQELLARGDAREMRRVEARLRKWLEGTYELVNELEQVIVELEEPGGLLHGGPHGSSESVRSLRDE